MTRALALVAAVLVTGCATSEKRAPLVFARDTAAQATSCPADELFMFEDEQGWMAAGCGVLASGSTPSTAEHSEPLTCASLSRFDLRLRTSLAKKTGTPLTAPVKGSCKERSVAMTNVR
jgi:hypothetical protein